MKKRVIGATIIVATALLLPKLVSNYIADTVNDITQAIDNNPAYSASIVSLDSDWFSTSAKVTVSVDAQRLGLEQFGITDHDVSHTLDLQAQHGPLIFGNTFGLAWAHWQIKSDSRVFTQALTYDENVPFYQLNASTSLFGNTEYHDNIAPFTFVDEVEQIEGEFSGFSGSGEISNDRLRYQGDFASLLLSDERVNAEINQASITTSIDGDWLAMLNNLPVASSLVMKIKAMKLGDVQHTQFAASQLNFSLANALSDDKELADIKQTFSLKNLETQDYQLQDLQINTALNNLKVSGLLAYQKLTEEMPGSSPEALTIKMQEFAQQHMLSLLTPQPELNIEKFSATLPEGSMVLTSFNTIQGVDAMPAVLNDPGFWIQHSATDTQLELDKEVALLVAQNYVRSQLQQNPQAAQMDPTEIDNIAKQQAPMMLDTLITQGLLVEEQGMFKSTITLKDGQLSINGEMIPLPY